MAATWHTVASVTKVVCAATAVGICKDRGLKATPRGLDQYKARGRMADAVLKTLGYMAGD